MSTTLSHSFVYSVPSISWSHRSRPCFFFSTDPKLFFMCSLCCVLCVVGLQSWATPYFWKFFLYLLYITQIRNYNLIFRQVFEGDMLSPSTAFVCKKFKQEIPSKSQATNFHITRNSWSNSGRVQFWLLVIVNMLHTIIIFIFFFLLCKILFLNYRFWPCQICWT